MKSNQTKSIGLRTGILITLALLAIQGLAQSSYEPYTFSTLAGGGGYSTNGAGSAARFWFPAAVAVDGAGNVYVVENVNNTISKVTPAGVITTLAGKAGSVGSVDGTGTRATTAHRAPAQPTFSCAAGRTGASKPISRPPTPERVTNSAC